MILRLLALLIAASLLAGADARKGTLLDRVIALNQIQEPELDIGALRAAFLAICDKVRPQVEASTAPGDRIAALNRILLADRKVSYLSNLYWRDATLAAAVLRGQGNCLSTSTLYVLVGAELGLPIHMVVVPKHAFARWDDGTTRINIETTSGGTAHPDSRYLRGFEIDEQQALRWGDNLDHDGFLAELTDVASQHRIGAGDLAGGRALLNEVERLAPWRIDLRLAHIILESDITKDRVSARARITALLERKPPATIATGALCWLANDLGAQGQPLRQRALLLEAFKRAPRSSIAGVLHHLAFCHRSLKDWRGAVRYLELMLACTEPGDPGLANHLYSYAILLKNDGRLEDAIAAIDHALRINPEMWNLTVIKAGYLCLAGRTEEGKALFATVKPPRDAAEFWRTMRAWFFAVSRQRDLFYQAFTEALTTADGEHILTWISQDVDLDVYRGEPEFRRLVEENRLRLLGEKAAPAKP